MGLPRTIIMFSWSSPGIFAFAPADPLREEETGQSVPSVVVRSSSEERARKKETRPLTKTLKNNNQVTTNM